MGLSVPLNALAMKSQHNNTITLILTEPEIQTQHDTEKLDNYITYHASWYRVLHKIKQGASPKINGASPKWCKYTNPWHPCTLSDTIKVTWAPGKAEKSHSHRYGLFRIACCSSLYYSLPIPSPNAVPYLVLHSGFDRKACFVACSVMAYCVDQCSIIWIQVLLQGVEQDLL